MISKLRNAPPGNTRLFGKGPWNRLSVITYGRCYILGIFLDPQIIPSQMATPSFQMCSGKETTLVLYDRFFNIHRCSSRLRKVPQSPVGSPGANLRQVVRHFTPDGCPIRSAVKPIIHPIQELRILHMSEPVAWDGCQSMSIPAIYTARPKYI